MSNKPLQVILDCDTANEIDDQFAIAYALGLPDGVLDVRGIISVHNTTVHGPDSRDIYQEEAERVVGLCGKKVPCIPGALHPMEDRRTPVPSEGLAFIVEEARKGPLTLISTGPATDVASFLLAAPELRERVRVVWLGGFGDEDIYGRWEYRMEELNGRADIAAWRTLLEEPAELLQVPTWPAPAKIVVEANPYAQKLCSLGRPVADYLADILVRWVEKNEDDPRGRKILWDISCVAAVADAKSVIVEPLTAPTLDAAGAYDFSNQGLSIRAVTDLSTKRILADMEVALAREPHGRS